MLSRVAESLYWMGRYIERAEDLTRLIAVNFNAVLDQAHLDAQQSWAPLVAMNGDESLFYEIYGEATAQNVIEFMLWQPLNPNAVTACITRARENARSVREQISSEMWEHLNRLYFLLRNVDRSAVLEQSARYFPAGARWLADVSGRDAGDDDAQRALRIYPPGIASGTRR